MSTLQKHQSLENKLCKFISDRPEVTDYTLKHVFVKDNQEDFENLGVSLCDIVDNLIYEKKIRRFYPKESQVPVYHLD